MEPDLRRNLSLAKELPDTLAAFDGTQIGSLLSSPAGKIGWPALGRPPHRSTTLSFARAFRLRKRAQVSAPMDDDTNSQEFSITWPGVAAWYAAAVCLGAVGTIIPYLVMRSPAWVTWSGSQAWIVDIVRLVTAAALSLFALWNLRVFPTERLAPEERSVVLGRIQRPERLAAVGSVLILTAAVFLPLAQSFIDGLPGRSYKGPYDFKTIYLPYFPYLLYIFAIWVGLVLPLLVAMARALRADWKRWGSARRDLQAAFSPTPGERVGSEDELDAAEFAMQNYTVRLKAVAERYVPLLLAVALALLAEQRTALHGSTTGAATEFGKAFLWLLLAPSLFACVAVVAFGYQNALLRVERSLRAKLKRAIAVKDPLTERLLRERTQLIWDRSTAGFLLSVLKSGGISIPLAIGLIGLVVKSLSGDVNWFDVLVPAKVREWLRVLS